MTTDILLGDCFSLMKQKENESIDLIFTSPPYWNQRDYGVEEQWGAERTVQEYLEKMKNWAEECRRILKNTGCLFLNIGDKYSKKGLLMIPERISLSMIENGWCLRNTIIWNKPNHMPSSVKDRFCNTYEYVYFFVKDSQKYYNYSYYQNIDCLRKQPDTPPTNEKWPLTLSISEYENQWKAEIQKHNDNLKYTGKFKDQEQKNKGQSPAARSKEGIRYSLQRKEKKSKSQTLEINHYLRDRWKESKLSSKEIDSHFGYKDTSSHWFRIDNGRSIPKSSDWEPLKELLQIVGTTPYDSYMTEEHYVLQTVRPNPLGPNPGDTWVIPTEKSRECHFAIFPKELASRIIQAFCPENGIVLDPFAGSGTTGMVCQELNRNCILMDCNQTFIDLMKKRLGIISDSSF